MSQLPVISIRSLAEGAAGAARACSKKPPRSRVPACLVAGHRGARACDRAGCSGCSGRPTRQSRPGAATAPTTRWRGASSAATRRCCCCPAARLRCLSTSSASRGIRWRPCSAQLDGERRAMSVARTDSGQLFLLMLSVGPDSVILENLPDLLKRTRGKVGITIQAVVEFTRSRLPRFDGGHQRRPSRRVLVHRRQRPAATVALGPARPGPTRSRRASRWSCSARHGRRAAVPFFFAIPRAAPGASGVERFSARRRSLCRADQYPVPARRGSRRSPPGDGCSLRPGGAGPHPDVSGASLSHRLTCSSRKCRSLLASRPWRRL